MNTNWFECRITYDKLNESGVQKTVTECYLVEAMSFTEAEARITEKIAPYITGDFKVAAVNRRKYDDVITAGLGDKYYRIKTNLVTIDEKTGTEKRTPTYMLVQSVDLQGALGQYGILLVGCVSDYELHTISETRILDVFKYDNNSTDSDHEAE